MNEQSFTIAVSGMNNIDSPGPGIPVVRGLRESPDMKYRIIGLAYENLEPGSYMHEWVDKTYKMPYPSDGIEAMLDRIHYIHDKEKISVLIPNFDSELFAMIKSVDHLKQIGINTFLPTLTQFEERQKSNLSAFGDKYGINVPRSIAVTDIDGLKNATDEVKFPCLIKGKFYEAFTATGWPHAQIYFQSLAAKWGLPIIVQEFVKGTEVNVVALGDGKGNTVGAVPMRKQYITDKGKAWGGITLEDPSMLSLTEHLIGATQWRGGMELELIRTKENKLYLIEINPRLPAWVYLAVGAGQNLPDALVRLALGLEVMPMRSYKVGLMFIRYSWDMICDIQDFEKITMNGEL